MKVINNYRILSSSRPTTVQMPREATILHCRKIDEFIFISVIEDDDLGLENRTFEVIGTGWEVEDNMRYVGVCHEDYSSHHVMEIV